MKKITYILCLVLLASCNGYLDVTPVGKVIPGSSQEYRDLLTRAYSQSNASKVLTAYRTDDIFLTEDSSIGVYYNDIYIWNDNASSFETTVFPYVIFYTSIFYANHIIDNVPDIEDDIETIEQILGEAYALRAIQYFSLINLYADMYNKDTADMTDGVPMNLNNDLEQDFVKKSVGVVYKQIHEDIENAKKYLNIDSQELGLNYRFSKSALLAMQSRVYLYQKNWSMVLELSQAALDIRSELMNLNNDTSKIPSDYDSVENILALEKVTNADLVNYAYMSNSLINLYDKNEDLRFDLYYRYTSNRYKSKKSTVATRSKTSYRTAELYLNMAEAYSELGQDTEARESLYILAQNRYTTQGYIDYTTRVDLLNGADLLEEILKERRRELSMEGHRWNDLRRVEDKQVIEKELNGTTYSLIPTDSRYTIPFPAEARTNNPNL